MKCALRLKKKETKPKQTYHNEHCWKYLQESYMKSYHHHRFHICLSLPWNSKRDHSLLATKTYNSNVPLSSTGNNENKQCHPPTPQKYSYSQYIYLELLGNSWKAFYHSGYCDIRAKHNSTVVLRMYNLNTLNMSRTA